MVYRLSHFIVCSFSRAKLSVWEYVFQFGWVVKFFNFLEIIYDSLISAQQVLITPKTLVKVLWYRVTGFFF